MVAGQQADAYIALSCEEGLKRFIQSFELAALADRHVTTSAMLLAKVIDGVLHIIDIVTRQRGALGWIVKDAFRSNQRASERYNHRLG